MFPWVLDFVIGNVLAKNDQADLTLIVLDKRILHLKKQDSNIFEGREREHILKQQQTQS